ncbi:hypothetical protein BJ165DRAFT_1503072 [Panaeolus papilionaceus]|nr:hypothetical protein BJ165DRAFT_1503072 [Panaeolus papilionaceus]
MLRNCFHSSLNQKTVRYVSRLSTRKLPPPKGGVNLLLHSLEQFASSPTFQANTFAFFIHKRLSLKLSSERSPHRIYEDVSNFLIRKQFPKEAVSVVQRMQREGYVPSSLLQAQIALLALANSDGMDEPLVEMLTTYFKSKDCTGKAFSSLFDTMENFSICPELVATFVSSYLESREPGFKASPRILGYLVRESIKVGDFDGAFQTTNLIPITPDGVLEARKAHIAILAAIRDTNTGNPGADNTTESSAVNTILSSMKEKGIRPNIAVMNVLLSREVRLNRRPGALRIYRIIQAMGERDPRDKPDAYTFGSMFALYRAISPRLMRLHHRNRDDKDPYPPRELFRDFIRACTPKSSTRSRGRHSQPQEPALKPNSVLLTTALRVFMRQRDYAGALVVLNSFDYMGVRIDNRTWYSVLKLLIRRVWAELSTPRSAASVPWGYTFLGLQDNWRETHGSKILDERIVNGILDSISRQSFTLTDPLYVPGRAPMKDSDKYYIPTMEMMEAIVPSEEAQRFAYEVEPLKRLLQRALLAQLMVQGGRNEMTAKDVSDAIVQAEKEMLSL